MIIGGGGWYLHGLLSGGVVTMADIMVTVNKVAKYLIPILLLLVVIIILLIVFRKRDPQFKFWLKWESGIILLVAIVLTLNIVLLEPLSSLINLNYARMGSVSEATLKQGDNVAQDISEEGTVLLKNTNNYLPLKSQKNINVFGWASTNPIYGGTGSGGSASANSVNIYQGLKSSGFKTNNSLNKFYTKYRTKRPTLSMMAQDWTLPEPARSQYSKKLIANSKAFSNTALVVIARPGGEGADLPKDVKAKGVTYKGNKGDFKKGDTYLQLTKSERDMLKMVNSNFKNVIVLVNSANPMELGWLNKYDHIKSALWMAGPGEKGFSALGQVLRGKVNPSGRTVDTYAYNIKNSPSFNNFGDFKYSNGKYSFVNYSENIYVGYKFYETYYKGNEKGYEQAVQYPFGYGMSYTTFTQKMSNLKQSMDGSIKFTVTVKNTGKTAGKDVVQAYYTAPYNNNDTEKAATNLLSFKKTKKLQPGASQTLNFKLKRSDMSSYSEKNGGAYVLDQGDYQIQIKENSHKVLDSKDYNVAQTVVYNKNNKRSSDKKVATNKFADASGDVNYLSRKDNFANYKQATAAPKTEKLTNKQKSNLVALSTAKDNGTNEKMPVTGKKGSLELADLRGKSYNDKNWDKLLDQLSIKDMNRLITYGGYQTVSIGSIKKAHTYDFDGPSGFTSFIIPIKATTFPVATMIAATWNTKLANSRGKVMGKQGNELGVSGWYGPAMNIHRNALAGRNFEYYSEDSTLSGDMAANEILGAKHYGVYAYMKHFAMNDQETNRLNKLLTWSSEQAIREIYLKPFEIAVKDGKASAAMSSFNYIGDKWSGANDVLLQKVLRGEWGFHGMVETDYFGGYGYMSGNNAIKNGNDLMLSTTGESGSAIVNTKKSGTVKAMRNASHNILYTVVNSSAYKNYQKGDSLKLPWQKTLIKYDIIVAIVLVALQCLVVVLYRRKFNR
ncbi:beta-glucosidase-related glycosidase [Liquorilactobacillus ghanensis DSM 18630]|uniref:Beta-glucosidase-related glycosidase n=1 Tax=Liquorilactobacillus ghanensis DSM 18630 TaxID=1423750 RepID=A0A0R1VVW3_9LACO|nr:beta-glucosidase-related glycosidase [Liquorilactobacillus ghanensis DSM 18630]